MADVLATPSARLAMILGTTAVFLGLAVLGRGGIAAFAVIALPYAYLPAWTDRHELWTIDGHAVRWLGVILFAAGGALRLWPVYVLGNRFSGLVAIQPGHTLLTTGIYGVIRHPSYLGLLVNALGWGLAFRSW